MPNCQNCPSGYVWSPYLNDQCYRVEYARYSAATTPYSSFKMTPIMDSSWDTIIATGPYSINGAIGASQLLTTNYLWKNPFNTDPNHVQTTNDGPVNRTFLNSNLFSSNPNNYWVGRNACVSNSGGTVYLGVGSGSGKFRILLNGILIFQSNGPYHSSGYQSWIVLPITLPDVSSNLPVNLFQIYSDSPFGFEIYNNTFNELTGATSINDLNVICDSIRGSSFQNTNGYFELATDSNYNILPNISDSSLPGFAPSICVDGGIKLTFCDVPQGSNICFTGLQDTSPGTVTQTLTPIGTYNGKPYYKLVYLSFGNVYATNYIYWNSTNNRWELIGSGTNNQFDPTILSGWYLNNPASTPISNSTYQWIGRYGGIGVSFYSVISTLGNCPNPGVTPTPTLTRTPTATPTATTAKCNSGGKFLYTGLRGDTITYLDCCNNRKNIVITSSNFSINECFQPKTMVARSPRSQNPGEILTLSLSGACTSTCVTPTPTNTSTKTPTQTPTLTTTPTSTVECKCSVTFTVSVPTPVTLTWTDCCGIVKTQVFSTGTHTIAGDGILSNTLNYPYLTVTNVTYNGCCSCTKVNPSQTSTQTPTQTPTPSTTSNLVFLQCCCSTEKDPLIIQPKSAGVSFIPGQVWADVNGYCWTVLSGSNYTVNTTYTSWGNFTYRGMGVEPCIYCCRQMANACPTMISPTPTGTPTSTPQPTAFTGLTPTATASNTPTVTPTLTQTPTLTSGPQTICVTYCSTDMIVSGLTCNSGTTGTITLSSIGTFNGRPYYLFNSSLGTGYIYFNTSFNQWVYQDYFDVNTGGYGQLWAFAGSGTYPTTFNYVTPEKQYSGTVPLSVSAEPCPTPTPSVTATSTLTPTPTSTNSCGCVDVIGFTMSEIYPYVLVQYEDCCGNVKGPFRYDNTGNVILIYNCIKLGSLISTKGFITIETVDSNPCCGQVCPTSTPTSTTTPTVTPTNTTTIGLTPTATPTNTSTPTVTPSATLCECCQPSTGDTMCFSYGLCEIYTPFFTELTPEGLYNGKPYYKVSVLLNQIYYIFWSIINNRWEYRLSSIGQVDPNGSYVWYLNSTDFTPSSTNRWIAGPWINQPGNLYCGFVVPLTTITTTSGVCTNNQPTPTPTSTTPIPFCSPLTVVTMSSTSLQTGLKYEDCCGTVRYITGIVSTSSITINDVCVKVGSVVGWGDIPAKIINVNYSGSCTASNCPSPTPTVTPTLTQTNTLNKCQQGSKFVVFAAGNVQYTTCCGTGGNRNVVITTFFEKGTYELSDCIVENSIISLDAIIGNIIYATLSNSCGPCTTPTPTPTTQCGVRSLNEISVGLLSSWYSYSNNTTYYSFTGSLNSACAGAYPPSGSGLAGGGGYVLTVDVGQKVYVWNPTHSYPDSCELYRDGYFLWSEAQVPTVIQISGGTIVSITIC
jgi:hypothetical protein